MDDDLPIAPDINRRHSFGGGIWKRLRLSKRKPKTESFVSYSDETDPRESFISRPTNFERRDIDRRDISLGYISIQECPFDVTGYGNLIMKEKFKLRRPKRKKIIVFLFEQIIIFTRAKKGEELYYYFGSVKIANLSLAPPDHNVTKIVLRDFVNSKLSKHKIEYKLEAANAEIQNSWRDALEKCLWQQLVRAKGWNDLCSRDCTCPAYVTGAVDPTPPNTQVESSSASKKPVSVQQSCTALKKTSEMVDETLTIASSTTRDASGNRENLKLLSFISIHVSKLHKLLVRIKRESVIILQTSHTLKFWLVLMH